MEPTWVLSAPDGPHVGPMNLAIRDASEFKLTKYPYLAPASEPEGVYCEDLGEKLTSLDTWSTSTKTLEYHIQLLYHKNTNLIYVI